jgi:uncharacterized protein
VSANPKEARHEDLPDTLAIFPLSDAVLLPRQILPLNIFEPRYVAMVQDALRTDRHIGMIQPQPKSSNLDPVPVYRIGCAGRITSFEETEDDRFLIRLTGVCRFRIIEEIEAHNGYRRIRPDWLPYRPDLEDSAEPSIAFERLEDLLRSYSQQNQLQVSWDRFHELPLSALIDFLAMHLPLSVEEKQALIEAQSIDERARTLQSVLEMAIQASAAPNSTLH